MVDGTTNLNLIANPGNLLGSGIGALGVGSQAQLQFSVSESLAADPVVVGIANGGITVEARRAGGAGLGYIYRYAVTSSTAAQGAYAVEVRLQDLAGNSSTVSVAGLDFVVDTMAPAAPDVNTDGRIVYTRNPWGTATSSNAAQYSLLGQPNAVESNATVRVIRPLVGELVRGAADASGAFQIDPLPLFSDAPSLSVQTIDAAGNVSGEVAVRNGVWIASLVGRQTDSSLINPHSAAAVGALKSSLAQDGRELTDTEYQSITQGAGPVSVVATQTWDDVSYTGGLNARALAGVTYHSGLGAVVVFGGFDGSNLGDTWTWDGLTWRNVSTVGGPLARRELAMVYDAGRDRVVLFGGFDGQRHFDDTWEWNGSTWQAVLTPGPSARRGHGMVYDEDRGVIVLHGGLGDTGTLNDTWEYDGAWRPVSTGCLPAPCDIPTDAFFGMAYDPTQGQVVKYGGLTAFGGVQDTWLYDGADWTRVRALGPGRLIGNRLVFDRARNGVLVYGGWDINPPTLYTDEAWLWDGASQTWSQQTAPNAPAPRIDHGMAYVDVTGETVVIGGRLQSGAYTADSAAYRDSRWLSLTQVEGPPRRIGPVMTTAPDGRVLLFGGEPGLGSATKFSDAWLFNGRIWERLATPALLPRVAAEGVYDTARDRVLIFGGETNGFVFVNNMESFDGTTWTTLSTSGPSPRLQHGMAYDPVNDRVVVFGGLARLTSGGVGRSNETWIFNPTNDGWTQVATSTTGPTPRTNAGMTYDPISGRVLMFGGLDDNQELDDMWSFDVATQSWTQLRPAHIPPARFWTRMIFAPDRGQVVLFAGTPRGSGARFDDTWEWDGSDWTEVDARVRPVPKEYHGLGFGGAPAGAVTFGGNDAGTDVWRKRNSGQIRPGVTLTFDWSAAAIDTANVSEVQVVLNAGATGGSEVLYWTPRAGRWASLQTNAAPPTAPAAIVGRLSQAMGRAAISADGFVNFLIQAADTLGTSTTYPEVAIEDPQVRVEYRLP